MQLKYRDILVIWYRCVPLDDGGQRLNRTVNMVGPMAVSNKP